MINSTTQNFSNSIFFTNIAETSSNNNISPIEILALATIITCGLLYLIHPRMPANTIPYPCYILIPDLYQSESSKLPTTYFEKESKKIVNDTVKKIQNTIRRSGNNNEAIGRCFINLINTLGNKRREIAEKQHTENHFNFGQKRSTNLYTPLNYNSQYREYEKKLQDSILNLYHLYKNTLNSGAPIIFENVKPKEYTSKFTLSLFSKADLMANLTKNRKNHASLILHNYTDSLCENAFDNMLILYGHMALEKNGTHYPLSDYFVFLFGNALDHITIPKILLLHQDPHFIKKTMEEVKACFIKCMNSQSEQELKENVAIFKYLFAHIAPYDRGSAAIAEWIEQALYKFKVPDKEFYYGHETSPGRYPLQDLDALTALSLSEFIEDYLSKVTLEKITPNTSTTNKHLV